MQRRTRRSTSTIGGAAPDTIIGGADADRAGARPYRATGAKARRNAKRQIARERVHLRDARTGPLGTANAQPPVGKHEWPAVLGARPYLRLTVRTNSVVEFAPKCAFEGCAERIPS